MSYNVPKIPRKYKIGDGFYMPENTRFQVRDDKEEIEKLEKAIKKLGYKNKGDWYREMKRKAIKEAELRD